MSKAECQHDNLGYVCTDCYQKWVKVDDLDSLKIEQKELIKRAAKKITEEQAPILKKLAEEEFTRLRERSEKLVEALKFYADEQNWSMCYRPDLGEYVPANSEGTSEIESDGGRIALAALAGDLGYLLNLRIDKLEDEK